MSQAAPTDGEPTPPLAQLPHADPDVPAEPAPPSSRPHPPSIPECSDLTRSTEETAGEDNTVTATKSDVSEGQADQPEPLTKGQVIECDQPVSLEPDAEAEEENVKVCEFLYFLQSKKKFEVKRSALLLNTVFTSSMQANNNKLKHNYILKVVPHF